MLFYQPELLLLCKYFYSKQDCTQIQIFTEYICKPGALLLCSRQGVEDRRK